MTLYEFFSRLDCAALIPEHVELNFFFKTIRDESDIEPIGSTIHGTNDSVNTDPRMIKNILRLVYPDTVFPERAESWSKSLTQLPSIIDLIYTLSVKEEDNKGKPLFDMIYPLRAELLIIKKQIERCLEEINSYIRYFDDNQKIYEGLLEKLSSAIEKANQQHASADAASSAYRDQIKAGKDAVELEIQEHQKFLSILYLFKKNIEHTQNLVHELEQIPMPQWEEHKQKREAIDISKHKWIHAMKHPSLREEVKKRSYDKYYDQVHALHLMIDAGPQPQQTAKRDSTQAEQPADNLRRSPRKRRP
jgi:predicted nucleotidyltransferase